MKSFLRLGLCMSMALNLGVNAFAESLESVNYSSDLKTELAAIMPQPPVYLIPNTKYKVCSFFALFSSGGTYLGCIANCSGKVTIDNRSLEACLAGPGTPEG